MLTWLHRRSPLQGLLLGAVLLVMIGMLDTLTGGLRLATGSIWPPVVAHGAWNL
ncbi:MAG: CPBP family intramembrane metalloprotease, partial [Chloroflexales bacterium]|nr:CPBP family intramembrane metalloprotease [Chloroflexales bacterium]